MKILLKNYNSCPKKAQIIRQQLREFSLFEESCEQHHFEVNLKFYTNADLLFFINNSPQGSYSIELAEQHSALFKMDSKFKAIKTQDRLDSFQFAGISHASSAHLSEGSNLFPVPKLHLNKIKYPVCFLDRDGVLIKDTGYPHRPQELIYLNDHLSKLKSFQDKGYKFIVITNQSGIARGYFSESDYLKCNSKIAENLKKNNIEILDWFHCPFHPDGKDPYKKESVFRKPMPGMILRACEKYPIDLKSSVMIGDKESDNILITLKEFIKV